jgi:hypothetical protein
VAVDVEKLIADITRRVTQEVLEALAVPQRVEDEYPDWDEYVADVAAVEDVAPSGVSSLRSRLQGEVEPAVDELAEDEDVELSAGTSAGAVAPLLTDVSLERRGGFDPRSNPNWFTVQYQRDVVLPSRAAPKGA